LHISENTVKCLHRESKGCDCSSKGNTGRASSGCEGSFEAKFKHDSTVMEEERDRRILLNQ
jgi:hypothetical protein